MDARRIARRLAVCTIAASTFLPAVPLTFSRALAQQNGASQNAPASEAPTAESISRWTSRQRSFEIPFQLADDDTTTVVELYSSFNGEAWQLYERRRGNDGKFVFKAAKDGAYWFTSRTIDAQNRPHPTGPLSAELLVIVDATPPQVEFDLKADDNNAVQCSWRIDDPGLSPQSLKLEYEVDGSWKPVAVQLPPQQMEPGVTSLRGGVTWRPEGDIAKANVRLTVGDAAGNLAQPVKVVTLTTQPAVSDPSATATDAAAPATPEAAQSPDSTPPKSPSAPVAAVPWNNGGQAESTTSPAAEEIGASPYYRRNPNPQAETLPAPSGAPAAESPASVANNGNGGAYQLPSPKQGSGQSAPATAVAAGAAAAGASRYAPNGNGAAASEGGAYRPSGAAVAGTAGAKPWYAEEKPAAEASVYGQSRSNAAEKPSAQVTAQPARSAKTNVVAGPVAGTIAPAVAKQAPQNSAADLAAYGDLPVESTNATAFQLDYDVEAVGPEGVAKVELWVTRNRGQDWEQYSEDPDFVSPINVEVREQGVYGFRVQVTGKNGLGAQPPKSGDQADIWIDVDTVEPVVELNNVPYGRGPTAGKLEIYWTAEDQNLAQRPVTLRYSESPSGPWTTIAASIPNEGKFLWAIEANTPKEVYLRLEVTDRAGNVGVDQLADPIRLQPLIPKARIRGFKPVSKVSLGTSQQTALLR